MSRRYAITTEGEEAVAAATAETLLQLRGTSAGKSLLIAWGVSFDGVTASDAPIVVRLLRQTTDGTSTGASEVKYDADDVAAACTGFHSFTVEPTASDVLETYEVHPQGGAIDRVYPLGREIVIGAANTSRLAIEVNAPAAVNALAYMHWEE